METSCKYQDIEEINELLRSEIKEHLQLERQLIEAKIAAEERTQAYSNLLSDMGHEIRTPMNSIIGMTSILLLDETLTDEQKEFIDTIRVSSDALMELINDILDFSRLESKKLKLDPQPFELKSFIKETLDLIAVDASKEGLVISHRFNGSVPKRIVQDTARLRQILASLLVNAMKLTDPGKIKLYISSRKIKGASEIHFEVRVQDTGKSSQSDIIGGLLEPLSGEYSPGSGDCNGSGLRLAISKRLVELMEGNIWVESKEGNGTTLNFTIKASPAPLNSRIVQLQN